MRYEARAALAMGAVVAFGAIGFAGLRSAMAPPTRAFPVADTRKSFVVRDPQLIQPDSSTYAQFAVADAAWRKQYADPRTFRDVSRRTPSSTAGSDWLPSPRQALDDRVYALSKAGRLDDAVAVLTAWVDAHPRDRAELLKLARLLNEAGHGDASVVRYRQLLALETASRQ